MKLTPSKFTWPASIFHMPRMQISISIAGMEGEQRGPWPVRLGCCMSRMGTLIIRGYSYIHGVNNKGVL